jgi:hypothetical protein
MRRYSYRTLVNGVRKCLSPQQVQYIYNRGSISHIRVVQPHHRCGNIQEEAHDFLLSSWTPPDTPPRLPAFCLPLSLSSIHVAGLCSPIYTD